MHDTQSDAIQAAREIARNQRSDVVIHRPDGKICDKDSYGKDPCPPPDKKHQLKVVLTQTDHLAHPGVEYALFSDFFG